MGETSGFTCFAQYWAEGEWAPLVKRLHSGKDRSHTLAVFEQPAGSFPDPAFPEFNVQLILGGTFHARVRYGGTEFEARGSPGAICLCPSDTDADYDVSDNFRMAALAIDKCSLDRFRDQADFHVPNDFGALHEQMFFDPIIEALTIKMLEEAASKEPVRNLFLDTATDAILTRLLCHSAGGQPSTDDQRPLADADLQRVVHLIEERLEDNLNIADLAGVTSLSDWHFARAFKAATGLSPHQFVLRRRIARAKDLLAHNDTPLAEVAVAAGFSSQSHMTDVFREKVGATPGRYRAQHRS